MSLPSSIRARRHCHFGPRKPTLASTTIRARRIESALPNATRSRRIAFGPVFTAALSWRFVPRGPSDVVRLAVGLGAHRERERSSTRNGCTCRTRATVSTAFPTVVLVLAATSRLRGIAVATSVVAMLSFSFCSLPPVGTWTIADPQNWVALFAFLAVSLVASNLSAVARARTHGGGGRAPRTNSRGCST